MRSGGAFVLGDAAPLAHGHVAGAAAARGAAVSRGAVRGAPAARPTATRRGSSDAELTERVRVALVAPREPLAWAIDAAFDAPDRPSAGLALGACPGARPRPRGAEAMCRSAAARVRIAVRVFDDDGASATQVVSAGVSPS